MRYTRCGRLPFNGTEAPSPDGEPIQELLDGNDLTVVCQVIGSPITASQLKRETKVWSQTKEGGYVSNAYLAGIDIFTVTTPCE